jgi:hypothetical protein
LPGRGSLHQEEEEENDGFADWGLYLQSSHSRRCRSLSLSLSRPFFAFSDYISFNFTLTPMLFGCFTIVDPINNSNTSQSAISPSFVFSLEI